MNHNSKTANTKTDGETENKMEDRTTTFKPSISIRRKQTRRLIAQVDQERADSFDQYVTFVSECSGYDVSSGDVMGEILKAHFARDTGFKKWRTRKTEVV